MAQRWKINISSWKDEMTSMSRGDSTVCAYLAMPDMATPDCFFVSVWQNKYFLITNKVLYTFLHIWVCKFDHSTETKMHVAQLELQDIQIVLQGVFFPFMWVLHVKKAISQQIRLEQACWYDSKYNRNYLINYISLSLSNNIRQR